MKKIFILFSILFISALTMVGCSEKGDVSEKNDVIKLSANKSQDWDIKVQYEKQKNGKYKEIISIENFKKNIEEGSNVTLDIIYPFGSSTTNTIDANILNNEGTITLPTKSLIEISEEKIIDDLTTKVTWKANGFIFEEGHKLNLVSK